MKWGLHLGFLLTLSVSLNVAAPAKANAIREETQQIQLQTAAGQSRLLEMLHTQPKHLLRPAWVHLLAQTPVSLTELMQVLPEHDPLWPHFYWWRAMQQPPTQCSDDFLNYARRAANTAQAVLIPESTALQERLHCIVSLPEAERLSIARQVHQHRYFWLMPRLLQGVQQPEGLWLLAQAQMTGRHYSEAVTTVRRLLQHPEATGEVKKQALIQAGRAERFLRRPAAALQWWNWIQPGDQRYYPEVLWERAELALAQNQVNQSTALLKQLIQAYPEHQRVPEALGLLLRQKLQHQDWASVQSLAQQLLQTWPQHELADQARYWLGRSLHQQGQRAQAREIWQEQVQRGALNQYYTQLAGCQLAQQDCFQLPSQPEPPLRSRPPQLAFLQQHPELQQLFARSATDLLLPVLPFVSQLSESERQLLLSYALRLNGNYFRAIRTLWQLPSRDPEQLRLMYPLHYDALQKENAARYRIPQALIAGLTWQESMYKADIRSPSGATGLMQLMPATAREIAPKAGVQGFQLTQLTDPAINIRLGTYYLHEQRQRWHGNLLSMIASYNAGPNAVARWMQEGRQLDKDIFVEQIPYAETQRYVKQVLTHMRVYQAIYAE